MDEYTICLEIKKIDLMGCVKRLLMWLTGKERSQGQLLDLGFEQRVRYWLFLLRWIRKEIEVGNIKNFEFYMLLEIQETVWLAVKHLS